MAGIAVKEDDVCNAIKDLRHPNGSTYSDIKKRLLSSNATSSQLRSLKIATAKGIQSGSITQDKDGIRFRLSNLLGTGTEAAKTTSSGKCRKPYCSKNIRKNCRRRYACNRRRGNLPYCSKYQTKCCRRRRKSSCSKSKPKPKPKPKKAKCAKKKKKKPKKKKCGEKKKKKPKKKKSCKPKPKPKKC